MKKSLFLSISVLGLVLCQAAAQTPAPSSPPKILSIFREEIKPGRAAAHEKVEVGYVKAFRDAGAAPYLTMTSMSGTSEAWFIVGYDSWDAYEKDSKIIEKNPTAKAEIARLDELDAAFRTNQRAVIAEYREDLSYNPNISIGQMRYVEVITFRVRPGHTRTFEEARKISKAAHEKARVDEHFAIFQVRSGMPGATFLLLLPHKSLKEMDTDPHTRTYQEALGEENRQKLDKMSAEGVITVENTLFAFNPAMSYPSPAVAQADPEFWNPKATKSLAAGKKAQVPKPAAQKKQQK